MIFTLAIVQIRKIHSCLSCLLLLWF